MPRSKHAPPRTAASAHARPASHRPRKRFSQHFLADAWARRVVAVIDPQPGDVFLEIGPGEGAITLPLAASGAPVLAVEIDRDLATALAARVPANVSIMTGDFLKTDIVPFLTGLEPQSVLGGWEAGRPGGVEPLQASKSPSLPASTPPRRFRLVGNLPYHLSTPILFRLIDLHVREGLFTDATIMLQREVAERLAARPGTKAWGVLSIHLQLHADIALKLRLPPGAFHPAPKVDSAVVQLALHPPRTRIVDFDLFERLVRIMFSHRRKTLSNALKSFDPGGGIVLALAKIDGRRRPETLDLSEIGRLVELFAAAKRPSVL